MDTRATICVTGVGAVTPAGPTADALWDAVRAGRSRAAPVPSLLESGHPVAIACVADDPVAPAGMAPKAFRRMDRFAQLGLAAGVAAFADARLGDPDPSRIGVVVGNAVGGRATSDKESAAYARLGPGGVSPLMPTMTMPNAAAAMLSLHLGSTGPCHTIATTCASGLDAIGHAMSLLWSGRADVVLAGGCEATITPVTMAAFAALNALSIRQDRPEAASRPFDADRDGFVMGEGAAFLALEREADAVARGASVRGRLLGYASSSDAYHLTQPHPEGRGAEAAMRGALREAGLAPSDIGHVNAHGTSTPMNDATEAAVIRRVFGDDAPPVTALKGVTGHMLGASGAAEALIALASASTGTIPPVANHTRTDPECRIDVVHGAPRSIPAGPAITNSFGFGGHNASLVVV